MIQIYFLLKSSIKALAKTALTFCLLLSFSASAMEHSHEHHSKSTTSSKVITSSVQTLTLVEGFVRAMPPGQSTTAIFLTLHNGSGSKVDIIDIEANIGHHAMLHETVIADEMAKMVHLETVSIEANSTLKLAPGGMHIMIMGVSQSLKLDQKINVTLYYSDEKQQTFEVPVAFK
jgi:periplasmic copper chaperone A